MADRCPVPTCTDDACAYRDGAEPAPGDAALRDERRGPTGPGDAPEPDLARAQALLLRPADQRRTHATLRLRRDHVAPLLALLGAEGVRHLCDASEATEAAVAALRAALEGRQPDPLTATRASTHRDGDERRLTGGGEG